MVNNRNAFMYWGWEIKIDFFYIFMQNNLRIELEEVLVCIFIFILLLPAKILFEN